MYPLQTSSAKIPPYVGKLDPRVKVACTILFVLTISLLPFGAFVSYAILLGIVILIVMLSGINLSSVLRRSLIVIPFSLAAITLPLTIGGEALFTIPIFGGLAVSVEGTIRFFSIVVKAWISVMATIVLIQISTYPELLIGIRGLHLPESLITIFGFMYRYLFVIWDEAGRLNRARNARSAIIPGQKGGRDLLWRGKVTGRLVGTLLLRSIERSERIYNAMLSRGYQSGGIPRFKPPRLTKRDIFTFLIFLFVLATILFGSHAFSV